MLLPSVVPVMAKLIISYQINMIPPSQDISLFHIASYMHYGTQGIFNHCGSLPMYGVLLLQTNAICLGDGEM